jgi:WS/DGAT/MGAT family acyltransferase
VCRRGGPLTLTAPASPFPVPIGSARALAGQAWPIERLRLIATCANATVNEVILTLCSGALREYLETRGALPTKPLVAMVPVSLRSREGPNDNAGNKIGALTCSFATHLEDPAERLAAVWAAMREGKSALAERSQVQTLAMSALGGAPLALAMAMGRAAGPLLRPANVMISNLPGPATPLYWNGARLDTLYPLSVPVDGQALNITCTTIDGQIAFGLTGCRRAVPDLHALAERLDRELNQLEKMVGSPSMLDATGRGIHAEHRSVCPATRSASEGLDAVR